MERDQLKNKLQRRILALQRHAEKMLRSGNTPANIAARTERIALEDQLWQGFQISTHHHVGGIQFAYKDDYCELCKRW